MIPYMQLKWLKFIYNGFLTGMPPLTYNAMTKTTFHAPFTIQPKSVYFNYALNETQKNYIQSYIHENDPNMEMMPVRIFETEETAKYYLSVNVYNCTSPIFFNNKNMNITRLEINTYIRSRDKIGTLLLDYTSNELSLDPYNGFKQNECIQYNFPDHKTTSATVSSHSQQDSIFFHSSYLPLNYHPPKVRIHLHDDLINYSDRIYYKNGIYDKLYYDSSLTRAPIVISMYNDQKYFQYKDLCFEKPMSIFYFENKINFIGGMWDNLFSHAE